MAKSEYNLWNNKEQEAAIVQKALPVLLEDFQPFMCKITKLHLCAFWPTREIAMVSLRTTT